MALTPKLLNQSTLTYDELTDFDLDNDLIGVGSAANAGRVAKSTLRLFLNKLIESESAQYAVADEEILGTDKLSYTLTNYGRTATVEAELPPATVGLLAIAVRLANYPLRFRPSPGQTFRNGAANGYLELTGYTTVVLECLDGGIWEVVADVTAGWRLENGYNTIAAYRGVLNPQDLTVNQIPGTTDMTTAINTCLALKGDIELSPGRHNVTGPLLFKEDTKFCGRTRGGTASIAINYAGAAYPIQLDGANSTGGVWVYNLDIEDIYFDVLGWLGAATHVMNITSGYSFGLKRVTIDSCPVAKKYVKISKVNHLELDTVRLVIGGSTQVDTGFDVVDGAGGEGSNGIVFRNCDLEVLTTGYKFSNSVGGVSCTIINSYSEFCTIAVDWNASANQSSLTMVGGIIVGSPGSTGVKIRHNHCTLIGVVQNNAGTYGVDVAGASSTNGLHVIGGLYTSGVNDPSKYLTTNTTATSNGGGDLRGRDTFAGAATKAVTFGYGLDTATYYVTVTGNVDERFWVTGKATSGFTLNSSNATSTAIVDWHVRN